MSSFVCAIFFVGTRFSLVTLSLRYFCYILLNFNLSIVIDDMLVLNCSVLQSSVHYEASAILSEK